MTTTIERISGDEAQRRWLFDMWAQAPSEHRTDVEGAAIAYRGWNLEATDLPGIVLVHGFRAHARWWDHIAPALARDHRVVALDFSGMGDSDRREEYTRTGFGREILAVAKAAGLDRPIIIAHSFGAVCAMIACRDAPEQVSRLIIIDSAMPLPGDVHQIDVPPRRVYPDLETAAARFRLIPPGGWPQPDILAYVGRHAIRQDSDAGHGSSTNMLPLRSTGTTISKACTGRPSRSTSSMAT